MSLLSLLSFSGICSRPVRVFVILIDQATFIAIVHPGDLPSVCSVCEYTFCGYVRYVWFELHLTHFSIVLGHGLFEAQVVLMPAMLLFVCLYIEGYFYQATL